MADQMQIIITLRKDVPDAQTGRAIFNLVKQRLTDRPDVEIEGKVVNHFEEES